MILRRLIPLLFLLAAMPAFAEDRAAVCYSCFWKHQPPEVKAKLIDVYSKWKCANFFCRGEVSYLLGNITENESLIKDSVAFYAFALQQEKDPARRLMLNMILGMIGNQAGLNRTPYLKEAVKLAREANLPGNAAALEQVASGSFKPQFGDVTIKRKLEVPPNAKAFILGESELRIEKGSRIAVQMERTFRDWLMKAINFDFRKSSENPDHVVDYHEGARLREIMTHLQVTVLPVTGTLLAFRDDHWFAPDETGTFRFNVLDDKVWYPTTKQNGELALMTDTHGISSLVAQAIGSDADLVIGCGDSPGKAYAAYYLATKGVNVYFPCDRFVGVLLGYDAPGVLLGSAPIHKEPGAVVIGRQPVRFEIGEKIVFTDVKEESKLRYNDAPARYFRALSEYVKLDLHPVYIDALGQAGRATAEAERIGATAIAVRAPYPADYEAMKKWLLASPTHRAILFHSAPYPHGYRLLQEFPKQVTFGDPHPRFVTE